MPEPVFESVTTMDQATFGLWAASRPSGDANSYELLNGRVVMNPPAGWPHGNIGSRLITRMTLAADAHALGLVFDASQGFDLPTGDTVEPDASFVSTQRWHAGPTPELGKFLRVVPDLVIEILSLATTSRDRGEKKSIYAHAGVREYVLIDPRARTLTVFVAERDGFSGGLLLLEDQTWTSTALPGLAVELAELLPR